MAAGVATCGGGVEAGGKGERIGEDEGENVRSGFRCGGARAVGGDSGREWKKSTVGLPQRVTGAHCAPTDPRMHT
jgi:hypothetical protein